MRRLPAEDPAKGKRARVFTLALCALLLFYSAAGGAERDILTPRVPADQLESVKALKNPFPRSRENIDKGREIFEGKGTCPVCHGKEGKGDGLASVGLDPSPRNFANPAFQAARTDGELFWVIKNGSPGTAMMPMIGSVITDEEGWLVLLYERSLGGK